MQTTRTKRTSFPDAVMSILKALKKGDWYSISRLSRETKLNRRTVEKALALLVEVQKELLEKQLDIVDLQKTKMVQLKNRLGLLSLPENVQKLIIRTAYFPAPSREEEVLVYLYLKKALSPETAIKMEKSAVVEKLLKQGQLLEKDDGLIYLSDEGEIVAKGALKIYPELENVIASSLK
ncbi:hypothetical protein J7L18_00790 [Candidatus Bathyarchaeota archaeon]|nr:hypothetical protein [Candidatus Bathyarchaeota archaeon]